MNLIGNLQKGAVAPHANFTEGAHPGLLLHPHPLSAGVAISVASGLMAVAGASYCGYSWHKHPMMERYKFNKPVSKNQTGYSVALITNVCDGWLYSFDVSVEMTGPSGKRSFVLAFEDGPSFVTDGRSPEPVITWLDNQNLEISIGIVGSVEKKLDQADGIHVSYNIGQIAYK